jgi:serine/threonine-protein kinase
VPVYEMGVFPDRRPYFVMKLVEGQTLTEMLAEHPAPGPERHRLLPLFFQVVQTVAYAHAHGVVHGDLTPSNVMLGKCGEVQVMDWGLAWVLSEESCPPSSSDGERPGEERGELRVSTGAVMGTPGYLAPERVRGDCPHPEATGDVFALGSILCEILTGKPEYSGGTASPAAGERLVPDPSEGLACLAGSGAKEELIGLVRDCLATDPSLRPRDAEELAVRLASYLDGVVERLRAAELARVAAQTRASEEHRRQRLRALLGALAVALAMLIASGYIERSQRRETRQAAAALVLREAEVLTDEADADPTGDPVRWRLAHDALRRVDRFFRMRRARRRSVWRG